jgi:hypothetical protein
MGTALAFEPLLSRQSIGNGKDARETYESRTGFSKMTKLLLPVFLVLSLIGCLELEGLKLSRSDLVQPRGIDGRWIVKYFGSKDSEKIAQIRVAADGTFEGSHIDAKTEGEKLEHWSMSLINTSSEEMFIALIRNQDQKDNKMILGALYKAQKVPQEATQNRIDWVLYLYDVEKRVPHDETAQWLKARYGLMYKKTDYGAAIQGTIDARTLKQMTGDPNWTKYFKAEPHAGITPLPKDHPYQARLDKALAKSVHRVSDQEAKKRAAIDKKIESDIKQVDKDIGRLEAELKKLCGGRVCRKTTDGREIYRTETYKPPRWYFEDGRLAPRSEWPK